MSNDHNPIESENKQTQLDQSNWYTKLHPIGTAQQQSQPKKLLNLSIFFRIWLAVAVVLIVSGTVVFTQLFDHLKPTAQQIIEDTLLDTSIMMAANLQLPLQSGQLLDDVYQRQLDTAFANTALIDSPPVKRDIDNIEGSKQPAYLQKKTSSYHLYVTDSLGRVVYDSQPAPNNAEGQDYSRWNDIYLTLKGQYGARSTHDSNSTRDTSVMYVAQPIKDSSGTLIGVVSVGKPVASVLPYLDNTRKRMLLTTLSISIAALILAGLVAWWLKQSISLVTSYTSALAEQTKKPYFYLGHELNSLTDTIETMKHRLENRAYVSDYVHTLTHELKSPLTAIRASSELLEDDGLDNDDRQMLNQTIGEQSIKMHQLIDRLLLLAKVEQPTFKLNRQPIALLPLLHSLIKDSAPKLQQRRLGTIELNINHQPLQNIAKDALTQAQLTANTTVYADSFWLIQALQNVLDNAIYFATSKVVLSINTKIAIGVDADTINSAVENTVTITLFNDGKALPDYALTKAFDRYFSLSHQSNEISAVPTQDSQNLDSAPDQASMANNTFKNNSPKKGTGLGLTLVKQVIEHHGGTVAIDNLSADSAKNQLAGVLFSITLPLAKQSKTKDKS